MQNKHKKYSNFNKNINNKHSNNKHSNKQKNNTLPNNNKKDNMIIELNQKTSIQC